MLQYWLAFMKQGNPSVEGLPAWPAYSPTRRATMVFGNERISVATAGANSE
jgi:carboxylesterase type B